MGKKRSKIILSVRFLQIEDNKELGGAAKTRLSFEGQAINWAQSIAETDALWGNTPYELILLDIMLPNGDGREFLKQRRQSN
jgi:DNA-binding response OmpR family regulator